MNHTHTFEVEIRQVQGREEKEIVGSIIQEGRVSQDRKEVFTPNSISWPTEGIAILAAHRGSVESRALPVRQRDGTLTIRARATDALREAVQSGKKYLSIEFHALSQEMMGGGTVREIRSALVSSAALVHAPSYIQTSAELRAESWSPWWR